MRNKSGRPVAEFTRGQAGKVLVNQGCAATEEQIRRIKESYQLLFRSKLGLNEALSRIKAEFGNHPEIAFFLDFVTSSKRGLTR